jgi:MFS family permease
LPLGDQLLISSSIIGRIVPAWAGDRLGRFNVTIFFTLLSAIFTFALWIPAPENNSAARMAYAALYGITSGVFVSLMPTLVVEVCPDMRQVGVFSGATYLAASPAILIAQPIGGALVRGGDGVGIVVMYVGMKAFAGLMMAIGGLLFIVARAAHMKQRNMTGLKA